MREINTIFFLKISDRQYEWQIRAVAHAHGPARACWLRPDLVVHIFRIFLIIPASFRTSSAETQSSSLAPLNIQHPAEAQTVLE